METESILLPKELADLITKFTKERTTGKITLIFKDGKIMTVEISMHIGRG